MKLLASALLAGLVALGVSWATLPVSLGGQSSSSAHATTSRSGVSWLAASA